MRDLDGIISELTLQLTAAAATPPAEHAARRPARAAGAVAADADKGTGNCPA
jgi:ribosomal protein L12E/L44/L45/RPP1/RPP2